MVKYSMHLLAMFLVLAFTAGAQQKAPPPAPASAPPEDFSGLYNFVQEGETLQLDVDGEKIGGFVSRYGSLESDRGIAFLDHFIKSGSLKGRQLAFTTGTVHGKWFDFKGRVERGAAKTHAEEGYYLLRGTLTEYTADAAKKVSARSRDVSLKSFPQEPEEQITPAKKPD